MNKCKGIFGFLFGHKYVDIFDVKKEYQPNNLCQEEFRHLSIMNGKVENPLLKNESKYIKSICKRCGHEIKRETKND